MPFSSKKKQREYQRAYQQKRRRSQRRFSAAEESKITPEVKIAVLVVVLFAVAALSLLSFFDLAGLMGAYIKSVLLLAFGWGSFAFPLVLLAAAVVLLKGISYSVDKWQLGGAVLVFIALLGILHHAPLFDDPLQAIARSQGGGYIGYGITQLFDMLVGYWGAWVVLAGVFISGIVLSLGSMLFHNKEMDEDRADEEFDEESAAASAPEGTGLLMRIREKLNAWKHDSKTDEAETPASLEEEETADSHEPVAEEEEASAEDTMPSIAPKRMRRNIKIPLDLLEAGRDKPSADDIESTKEKIQKTLATFNIPVDMNDVHIGPTFTQYTLKPSEGVKLSRITALSNDLALALAAHPLRIEAPIPGKSLVGVEVPNSASATVKLKDILLSTEFKKRTSPLSLGLGKDVSGKAWVVDLGKMPHLLIAGSTGSGKSVAINALIVSLLYQNSPDDLKLVLVDPKKVELNSYNDIPYLLTPVITDVKKTVNALKWVISEMERRYQLLSNRGKKNIESYNTAHTSEPLPYIVFIIDELADLMSVAARDVEGAIVRLAQMARAVGIHLVLATQRPSVNVITGLIKANIPSRIAFSVPSQIDSRTILDMAGAEKLLGRGDMLFVSPDVGKPRRLQGAFLSDQEIDRVVTFLKGQGEAAYQDEIVEYRASSQGIAGSGEGSDEDDLYGEAKAEVLRAGKASASLLQRRLRIGYSRAARLLDILENEGVVGPADGAKPRDVLAGEFAGEVEKADPPDETGINTQER